MSNIQKNTLLFKEFVNFFGGNTENQKYDALMLYVDGLCRIENEFPAYIWDTFNPIDHSAKVQNNQDVFIKHNRGAVRAVGVNLFNTSAEVNITSSISTLNYEEVHPDYFLPRKVSDITVNQGSQTDGYERHIKHNDTHYRYYKRPNTGADEIRETQLADLVASTGEIQYPEFNDAVTKIYNVPFDLACFIHNIYTSLVTNDDGSSNAHPIPNLGTPIYMDNNKYNNVLSVIYALGSKRMSGTNINEDNKYSAFINIVKEHVRIFNAAGDEITGQNQSWANAKFFYYKHVNDLRYKVQIVARDKPSGSSAPLQLRDVSPFTDIYHTTAFDVGRTAAQALAEDTALLGLLASTTLRAAANAFVERGILHNGVYVKIPNVNARNIGMVLAADRETRATVGADGAIVANDQTELVGFGGPDGQVRVLGAAKVAVPPAVAVIATPFPIPAYGGADPAAALANNLTLVPLSYNEGAVRVCGAANAGDSFASHVFRALYASGNAAITGAQVTLLITGNLNGERAFSELTVGQLRTFANNVRKILAPIGKVPELKLVPGLVTMAAITAGVVQDKLGVAAPAVPDTNLTNMNKLLQGWGTANGVGVEAVTTFPLYFGYLNTLINAGLHATVGVVSQQKNYGDLIKSVDYLINVNTIDSKLNEIKKRDDTRAPQVKAKQVVSIILDDLPRIINTVNAPIIAVKTARDLTAPAGPAVPGTPVSDNRTHDVVTGIYIQKPKRHNQIINGLPTEYNLYSDGDITNIAGGLARPITGSTSDGPTNPVLASYREFIKNKFSVRKYSRFARLQALYGIEERKIKVFNLDDEFFTEPNEPEVPDDKPYTYYRKKEDRSKLYMIRDNKEVEVQEGSDLANLNIANGNCTKTTGLGGDQDNDESDKQCTNFLLSCVANGNNALTRPSDSCQAYFTKPDFWSNIKKEVLEALLPFESVYVLEKLGFEKVQGISPEGKLIIEFEPIANWYNKINEKFDKNTYDGIKNNQNLKKYIDLVHGNVNSNPAILNSEILQKSSKTNKSKTNKSTSSSTSTSKSPKTRDDIPMFNSSLLKAAPYSLIGGSNNRINNLDNFIIWYKNKNQSSIQRGGSNGDHFEDFIKNNDKTSTVIKSTIDTFKASKEYDIKFLEARYKTIIADLSRKHFSISSKDQIAIDKLFANIKKEYIKIAKSLAMLFALEQEQVFSDQDDETLNTLDIQNELIAKITKLNSSLTRGEVGLNNVMDSMNKHK